MELGIVSDTHDLLRPEALAALAGVELIVHAGDVCRPEILERLERIAPVRAVRGNCDHGDWARTLPGTDVVQWRGLALYVLHDLAELDLDPAAAGLAAVIHGHSHRPCVEDKAGVLYVNPGSAGPRRFRLPVALARASVRRGRLAVRIVPLID